MHYKVLKIWTDFDPALVFLIYANFNLHMYLFKYMHGVLHVHVRSLERNEE